MKRLLILFLVIMNLSAFGQPATVSERTLTRSLYLRDWWVDSVRRDTAFSGATRSVPTADAVARYLATRASSAVGPVVVVDNIADLRSGNYHQQASGRKVADVMGYYAPGDGGGGAFYFDDTATRADNWGTVIRPDAIAEGAPGRWRRIVQGEQVNVLWFGFKPTLIFNSLADAYDNTAHMEKLLSTCSVYGTGRGFREIYFPQQPGLNGYFFDTTLTIRHEVRLLGGSGTVYGRPSLFFYDTRGLHIEDPVGYTTGSGTFDFQMKDLIISDLAATLSALYRPYDGEKHGIWTNVTPYYENVQVQYFRGDGLHLSGDQGDANYGNANMFYLSNCGFSYNAGYGLRFGASDVNASLIEKCNFSSNGHGGVRDDSFLGVVFVAPHTNSNMHYGQDTASNNHLVRTRVNFGGTNHFYVSRRDNVNQRPLEGQSSAYWTWAGTGPTWQVREWNDTTHYLASGAYIVTNNVAQTWLYGAYAEDNQFHSYLGDGAVVFSTLHAVPVVGGGMLVSSSFNGVAATRFNSEHYNVGGGVGVLNYGANGENVITLSTSAPLRILATGAGNGITLGVNSDNFRAYQLYQSGKHAWGMPYWATPVDKFTMSGGDLAVTGGALKLTDWDNEASETQRLAFDSAAPTTGDWTRGDIVYNSNPSAGATYGWRCTAAGSPGTWEALTLGGGGLSDGDKGDITVASSGTVWTVDKPALATLADGATITWDYATHGPEAAVTLGGNRTLSLTNLPAGKVVYLTLEVVQDATGGRTLALPGGTTVISGGAGAVTLSTAAGATDLLTFRWNGTTLQCTYGTNYTPNTL